ncbi:MAG: endolytic transglycosylase MltG [Burkholderiales bacterium]|nr:endolytic transglycosylase MltG [Burkholderiales bacterium]
MRIFFAIILSAVLGAGMAAYFWVNQPLELTGGTADLSIEPGASAREVASSTAAAGVSVNPTLLYWWFRSSGDARQIRAGSYEVEPGTSPRTLLRKLVRGEEALRSVTLVEGWTFRQVMDALGKAEQLKPQTQGMTSDAIMLALGMPGVAAEGRFFPDTYTYSKGSADLAVLKRAARAMDKKLAWAWEQRSPQTPLQTPEQALILASIVEKETGRGSDRPMVSSVFNNRLRIGMRLQTDPTVIYGLGESFDGNLRKKDLLTDTPWNTYTRAGLPPTPIAMPGTASLLAAVQPAPSKALYFVARGDGTSAFSASLDEHNRAVNKHQRGQ